MNPFRIDVPQADLDDLRDRLARTRWPAQLPGGGWSRGVPVGYLRDLATYWRTGYDWREHEAALNELDQFTTDIDGQTVHFLHVRSAAPHAVPLLITHSWPGSVVELTRLLGPLASSFHVVAPSIPGFGFSAPPREAGWTLARIAGMWLELMSGLGYERFGVHGNDAGALISPEVARLAPGRVLGVHVSGGLGIPSGADFAELTEDELAGFAGMREMMDNGSFLHASVQAARPQTFAYGWHDSPVAQLAWIVEKFRDWTDPAAQLPEDAVDRDQLLTNVTLYWLTGTAATSTWLYYDGLAGMPAGQRAVPSGNAAFGLPNPAVRRLAERDNDMVHWTEYDRGGHFAAMEVPDLLAADIRRFFDTVAVRA